MLCRYALCGATAVAVALFFLEPSDCRVAERAAAASPAALLKKGQQLQAAGSLHAALEHFEQALALARHRAGGKKDAGLALYLLHMGGALANLGEDARALDALHAALELYESAGPDGQPNSIPVLLYIGAIHLHKGERAPAQRIFQKALDRERRYLKLLISCAPEAQALALQARTLAFARTRQPSFNGYLTATRGNPELDAKAYEHVWEAKNLYTHFLSEQLSASREAWYDYARGFLQIKEAADARLEAQLAGLRLLYSFRKDLMSGGEPVPARETPLPFPAEEEKGKTSGPEQLSAMMPAGVVFLDFVRYTDFTNRAHPQAHYAVFILAPGRPVRRVELGPAQSIDEAVLDWQSVVLDQNYWASRSVEAIQSSWENKIEELGRRVRKQIWDRLRDQVPEAAHTLYIAPDGALIRFPFAALPGDRPQTILLERYRIANVPDGPFFLGQLQFPPSQDNFPGNMLVMAGVQYDPHGQAVGKPFEFLPGTVKFLRDVESYKQVRQCKVLQGTEATPAALTAEMGKFRHVYLGTHAVVDDHPPAGQQAAGEGWHFASFDLQKLLTERGPDPLQRAAVICALANVAVAADGGGLPEGGAVCLRAKAIAEMKLFQARLVVLAACRTTAGEILSGEGVQSLQRAFHVAACPNVIASVWETKDAGTTVLMREFYRQLWVKRVPPIEALRQAQLLIYHNPDLALGGVDMGPPDKRQPGRFVPPASGESKKMAARRGATRIYAAYVLSGVGQWQDFPVPSVETAANPASKADAAPTAGDQPAGNPVSTLVHTAGWLAAALGAAILLGWVLAVARCRYRRPPVYGAAIPPLAPAAEPIAGQRPPEAISPLPHQGDTA